MVLEPLSDNPDLFLRTSDQAYTICRAVDSPACKILYDMYHMQRNEGHIIEHIELGVERDRVLPDRRRAGTQGTGHRRDELPEHLQAHPPEGASRGKTFVLGMEHGNFGPGIEGEQALIEAYVKADSF